MALEEYKRKRNFAKTPEPSGDASGKKAKKSALFFCVQKHLASHLHYDFRLEWNGVLLSWAVPKGPSINPADKRLAMQTEDHPFDYGTFEGVIPEGYGAGIVMLWDRGTWTPENDDVDAALRKGDLKFTLDGFKLKGSWVLIRTEGRFAGAGAARSQLAADQTSRRLGRAHRHHHVRAAQRQDARRRPRRHSRRGQPRHLAQPRARQGRGHRSDVSAHHRAGSGDQERERVQRTRHQAHEGHEGHEGHEDAKGKASKPTRLASSKPANPLTRVSGL